MHFRFSSDLISRKAVVVEQNGPNSLRGKSLLPAEYLSFYCYVFKVSLGHVHFQFLTTLYLPLT